MALALQCSHSWCGLFYSKYMEKIVIVGLFAVAVAIFLVAYEKPSKAKKKLTGRGGDFES